MEISLKQNFLLSLPFIIIAVSGYLLLHSHQLEKNKPECWICNWRQWIFAGSSLMIAIIVLILAHSFSSTPQKKNGFPKFGGLPTPEGEREDDFVPPENSFVRETELPGSYGYPSGYRDVRNNPSLYVPVHTGELRGDDDTVRPEKGFTYRPR